MKSGTKITLFKHGIGLCIALLLSACVTQQYVDENDSPVVQNDATTNEIAMTRISLGVGYLKMGNTKQAKFNLDKAKRFAPNLVQVHTAFAHYYETVGESEQAVAAYEKALSIKDDDADTLNNYGVFLCRQGQLAQAEEQFLKAIAVPSYILVSESYENLALCHLKAEKFKKADEYLNKSIEHSPTRASALLQMATLQYAKGNYAEAKAFVKRYEKSTRRFNPQALALSFKVYEKLRNIKVAKNYAGMLIKMFPNSYEAKQYLLNGLVEIEADKLAAAYRLKNASKKKKRVVKLTPNSGFPKPVEKPTSSIKKLSPEPSLPIAPKVETQNVEKVAVVTAAPVANKLVAQNENRVAPLPKPQAAIVTQQPAQIPTQVLEKPLEKTAEPTLVQEKQSSNQVPINDESDIALAPEVSSNVENFLAKSSENAKKVLAEKNSELTAQTQVKANGNEKKLHDVPVHIVEKSEGLFKISMKHNIQIRSLLKWNNIDENHLLKVGDVIYLADPNKVEVNE